MDAEHRAEQAEARARMAERQLFSTAEELGANKILWDEAQPKLALHDELVAALEDALTQIAGVEAVTEKHRHLLAKAKDLDDNP